MTLYCWEFTESGLELPNCCIHCGPVDPDYDPWGCEIEVAHPTDPGVRAYVCCRRDEYIESLTPDQWQVVLKARGA